MRLLFLVCIVTAPVRCVGTVDDAELPRRKVVGFSKAVVVWGIVDSLALLLELVSDVRSGLLDRYVRLTF